MDKWIIAWTMLGAIGGGLLFEFLNQLLNDKGAFLRKSALFKQHVQGKKRRTARRMLHALSTNRFLHQLPPEEVAQLIQFVKTRRFVAGEAIIRQGEEGRELFFIVKGEVEVVRDAATERRRVIARLGAGETFGEMALITEMTRSADVLAVTDVEVYVLEKGDYENLLKYSLALQDASVDIMAERLQDISEKDEQFRAEALQWQVRAQKNLNRLSLPVTGRDMAEEVKEHGGAAMAIWLGIALDGIPESLVIGMLTASAAAMGTSMSFAFIVGVFLANLPEAMSSAVTMQRQGSSFRKIFWMWMSLCIMTGAGAMLGAVMLPDHPTGVMQYGVAGIEGLAAGAMLTMIANTMLPEAFEHGGGTIAGLSTLAGFLAALAVKVLGS
jgi:CRP-like cAMP-binding protein